MSELVFKSHEEIVEEMLIDFANELGVDRISNASDIAIKSRIYAAQIEGIYYNQDYILKQAFPQTATEDKYLEMHGELATTDRKQPTNAVGYVIMGRKTPYMSDILIESGTMVSTEESYGSIITAITTEDRILKAGELEIEVPIETVEKGSKLNLEAGSLTILVKPPIGIEYVRQDDFLKDGTDLEDFEVYRERVLTAKRKPKRGGAPSDYEVWAQEVDGVTFAKSFPLARGNGTIDVLIATDSGIPSDELVATVQNHIDSKKPAGADVRVVKPELLMVDLDIQILPKAGETLDTIKHLIIHSVKEYIKFVAIGGTVYINAMINSIFETKKIVNAKIITPTTDIELGITQVAKVGDINVYL